MKRRNWNMARAWFQPDGATAHTARLSMNTLRAAFPGDFSLGLVTISGPPIHRTLLQQTLWGYLKAQVFTHNLPDINSLRCISSGLRMLRRTLRRVMASVTGRWQQCLDCHGGHLQDVLKTEAFFVNPRHRLNRVQL